MTTPASGYLRTDMCENPKGCSVKMRFLPRDGKFSIIQEIRNGLAYVWMVLIYSRKEGKGEKYECV